MSDFLAAYNDWNGKNRDTRTALWVLCTRAYDESQTRTIVSLADSIGRDADTVGNWARVGWLVGYACSCFMYSDEHTPPEIETHGVGTFGLYELWHGIDALSYDHLLRVAKLARRLELSPDEILERLYNAAMGGQKAESLERDIEEAHEDTNVLLRRDVKTLTRYINSMDYRESLPKLQRALALLQGRARQALEMLQEMNEAK